jgi:hypothetical protein
LVTVYGDANAVLLEGSTMTGPLYLSEDPAVPGQAMTKNYGDNNYKTVVEYTSGAWPARPASAAVVEWIGPTAPPTGAGGSQNGDTWTNSTASGGSVTIDTTAADIEPNGTQAAGAVGKAADSGHVHPSDLIDTTVQTANYTAAGGQFVLMNATSGTLTCTLPTAPPDKTRIGVKAWALGTGYKVTVAAGGTDVFNAGPGQSVNLTLPSQAGTWQYDATQSPGAWVKLYGDIPLSSLINSTAATIAAPGIQAAGASGVAADAAHVHPGLVVTPQNAGVVAWTMDPLGVAGNTGALNPGIIFLIAFWTGQAETFAAIAYNVSTAGGTLTSGENFAGIYSVGATTATRVAVTPDQTTNFGSTGVKTPNFTASYIGSAPGMYYAAFLCNGTTGVTLTGGSTAAALSNVNTSGGGMRLATYGTGQTTLPGTLTLSSLLTTNITKPCAVIY